MIIIVIVGATITKVGFSIPKFLIVSIAKKCKRQVETKIFSEQSDLKLKVYRTQSTTSIRDLSLY